MCYILGTFLTDVISFNSPNIPTTLQMKKLSQSQRLSNLPKVIILVIGKVRNLNPSIHFHFSHSCIGEGNGNPLQYSYLEDPMDGGAWWAAVYGVAQSRTRLKRLSSSSSKVYLASFSCVFSELLCENVHYFTLKKLYNRYFIITINGIQPLDIVNIVHL